MIKNISILAISSLLLVSCGNKKKAEAPSNDTPEYNTYLLVGTYTAKDSKGVNVYKFNTETGDAQHMSEAEVSNPSYLAVSSNEKFVYAISENDAENSKVTAFKLNKEAGMLEKINTQATGAGPSFVAIDMAGDNVVTADYGGGSVTVFQTEENGGLKPASKTFKFEGKGAHPERQTKSYMHNVIFSPDECFLFANDLGTDKIYRFEVDNGAGENYLTQTEPKVCVIKAGSGPRHSVFHPNGKYMYTITEISGEVLVFDYNVEEGLPRAIQSITADTLNAQGSGDIQIVPSGKYLYASNRLKGDGLAIFSVDESTGKLTKIGYQETGIHPRNFAITPNGKLLLVANRDTNNIQVFKIEEDGLLTNLNKDIELSMPVCLKFASIK